MSKKAQRKAARKFLKSNTIVLKYLRLAIGVSPDVSDKQMGEIIDVMIEDYRENHSVDSFELAVNGPGCGNDKFIRNVTKAKSTYDDLTYGGDAASRFKDVELDEEEEMITSDDVRNLFNK